AQAKLDLAVVSVLLDAGAGAQWRYKDHGVDIGRSEGLAVASLRMFMAGTFSSDANNPLRADATALCNFNADLLTQGFQVGPNNPLVGVEGRVSLLRQLGEALKKSPQYFGSDMPRPGGIYDALKSKG